MHCLLQLVFFSSRKGLLSQDSDNPPKKVINSTSKQNLYKL